MQGRGSNIPAPCVVLYTPSYPGYELRVAELALRGEQTPGLILDSGPRLRRLGRRWKAGPAGTVGLELSRMVTRPISCLPISQ